MLSIISFSFCQISDHILYLGSLPISFTQASSDIDSMSAQDQII